MSDSQLEILLQFVADYFTAFVQLFVSSWQLGFAYLAILVIIGLLVWVSRVPWDSIKDILSRRK